MTMKIPGSHSSSEEYLKRMEQLRNFLRKNKKTVDISMIELFQDIANDLSQAEWLFDQFHVKNAIEKYDNENDTKYAIERLVDKVDDLVSRINCLEDKVNGF